MECPNCRAVIQEGNRFCSNCGYAMPVQAAIPQSPAGQPAPAMPPPAGVYGRPVKDPNTALVIELVGTFFGFMGLGWLYAGHTNRGIIALLIWLVVVAIAAVISVLTGGLFACVWLPLQAVAAVVSGLQVKQAVEKENWGALR